jgi:ribonuclease R
VHVATLGRDYYRFEADRRALVGERSGQRFTLGDRLKVRVTRVDPSERKIDFEMVEQVETAFHPRRKEGRSAPVGATGGAPQNRGKRKGGKSTGSKRQRSKR